VIGVVDDVRQAGLDRAPRPQLFVNLEQSSNLRVPAFPIGAYYAVRTSAASSVVIAHVHDIVREIEPRASVENVATMDQIVSNSLMRPRLYAVLLGIFAAVAVFLAAAGIFGVMAFAVVQRTREIGIRMALGAQRAQVLRLVLGRAGALTFTGLLLGLAGATATTRYLEAMLFGLTPLDATTFAAVAVLFSLVAATAAYLPARRATRVDPLVALRCE
jgi:putative ABC transport system permease protein